MWRVKGKCIQLPTLSERTGDIQSLAEHFLATTGKRMKTLSSDALDALILYEWPGNVRELQHAIERAIIMCEGDSLQSDDFFLSGSKERCTELDMETYNLDQIEKNVITKVLKQYNGNITQAATELGITRTSLYRRMEKYGL